MHEVSQTGDDLIFVNLGDKKDWTIVEECRKCQLDVFNALTSLDSRCRGGGGVMGVGEGVGGKTPFTLNVPLLCTQIALQCVAYIFIKTRRTYNVSYVVYSFYSLSALIWTYIYI